MKEIEPRKPNTLATKKKAPIKFSFEEKDGKKQLTCTMNASNNKLEAKEIYHEYVQELTGTKDSEIGLEIINRAVKAMPQTNREDYNRNIVVQSLADFKPNSAEEARLCAQAAALYARGMRYLNMAEYAIEKISDANVFAIDGIIENHNTQTQFAIKLLRLHNETIEVLNRLRRGNDQKITVQHVQVNNGGQAMVGNFQTRGGVNRNNEEPHE